MLDTPWRKESKDLIKDYRTFQERFEQVKDEGISNRHQYECHSEILDKAMEDMNNAECDNFDNAAPNAEHVNQQDCAVKDKPNDALRLFLSGGAGVGKSTVTNALYEVLIRFLNSIAGENPDDVKVVKTAPTGKAAFNIKGNTLHGAFKILANRGFEYCALDSDRLNIIRAKLNKLMVIFINDISMVGSGIFNFLNLRLQQIMGTSEPFSGISLVTVGGLFQLKPVFDKWIFENSQSGYNEFATNIWTEYFTLFELTEIMRQKDDKEFAQLLSRLREGNQPEDDIAILKQRLLTVRPQQDNYPMNTTHLFTTNTPVDAHNNISSLKLRNRRLRLWTL
ncbi:ATP-dependent DNA helicase PIF1-like [Orbicella faveolata]|uniref:ATP-dependent DNA helicase PIF1-like n=1 Tax=Orbicella faveolata TaxID=48498 RepID=UPI0009E51F9F|nr:ATP-dependent DNA helicase PIF1-like [Orbicella faveolata]